MKSTLGLLVLCSCLAVAGCSTPSKVHLPADDTVIILPTLGEKLASLDMVLEKFEFDEKIGKVAKALSDIYEVEIVMPKWVADRHVYFHLEKVGLREAMVYLVKDANVDVIMHGSRILIVPRKSGPSTRIPHAQNQPNQ